MNHYFKRDWDETTEDDLTDTWGTSIYYFETDEEFYVTRQIVVYEKGQVVKYHNDFIEDELGGLAEGQIDKEDFQEFSISKEEFETAWKELNRKVE